LGPEPDGMLRQMAACVKGGGTSPDVLLSSLSMRRYAILSKR
jgi:hypothetical protein